MPVHRKLEPETSAGEADLSADEPHRIHIRIVVARHPGHTPPDAEALRAGGGRKRDEPEDGERPDRSHHLPCIGSGAVELQLAGSRLRFARRGKKEAGRSPASRAVRVEQDLAGADRTMTGYAVPGITDGHLDLLPGRGSAVLVRIPRT